MPIPSYICTTCGDRTFTRRTSAKRHNYNIHADKGEILPMINYLTAVSQGKYRPPIHRSYTRRRTPNFGYIIPGSPPEPLMNRVRDSMGDTAMATATSNFRPGVLQGQGGQYPSYLQQHVHQIRSEQSPSLPPSTTQISAYPNTTAATSIDQSQSQPAKTGWGTMSEDTIPKIVELRRLLNRNPTIFTNPDMIIQGAKHFCMMGDNSFLDEKLAYLRSVDAIRHIDQQPSPS
jgi:hypothetical protein